MQKKILRGILVGLAASSAAFLFLIFDVVQSLEWKSWDARLRLFSHPSRASPDIVIFLIDQYSLDVYEEQQGLSWPWPRQLYSAVVDFLHEGGAKACFFDLILSESSRYGVEDDGHFARSIAEAGNVFLPLSLSRQEEDLEDVPMELLERFARVSRGANPDVVFSVKSASLPLPGLLSAAKGAGNVLFSPDEDGIFRRLPLFFSYEQLVFPSLPLAVARFVRGEQEIADIPFDRSGQMIIRYYGPTGTYRSYSIAAVINSWALLEEGKTPQISPGEFKDKVVLVGGSAPGILDLRPTPFSPVCPGVEIQATVINNLLGGDFVRVPPFFVLIMALLFVALFTGIGVSSLRKIWHISLFFVLCLALPAAAAWAAFSAGFWLDFVIPEIAVFLSFTGASLLNYSLEGRQRRFIKSVFRYYLSSEVVERVLKDPSLLRLGGEKREITSFFSDVAGFTTISERLSPEELVNLLNEYLSGMTEIILASGGTLDKYEGDAIIAFWNAPVDQLDHASRACRAALECQRRLAEMRPRLKERYGQDVYMRIGLNSGPAVVGNMGSGKRFDYTAIGDTVNLAARLEGACKQFRVPLLAGEETYAAVKEQMAAREVDKIRVVGKRIPVSVYEIIGEREALSEELKEKMQIFASGLAAYRKREWDTALALFQKLENDGLAGVYAERCRSLKLSSPPEDWDGIFVLKEK